MRAVQVVVAMLAAAGVLLVAPSPAGAHAELTASEPASGAQLDAPPGEIRLSFTESVEVDDDAVEVLTADGEAVEVGEASHPDGEGAAVVAALPDLGDGAYVVSWRVTSSDSHPISGAFTFAVGDASAADAEGALGNALSGSGGDRPLGIVYGIDRFAAFAGLVVLVGGSAFVLALWPAGLGDRRARRLLAVAWWVTLVATAAGIGLQGAYAAGGTLADALDPSVIGDELSARVGRVWAIRLVLLVLVALLARAATRRWRRLAGAREAAATGKGDDVTGGARAGVPADGEVLYGAVLLGLGLLVTVSLAGHAASGDLVALALVTDVAHLAGVSTWLGGLALLAVAVLRRPPMPPPGGEAATAPEGAVDVPVLERVVGRFSTVAFIAVAVIVASGVVQSWRQLGTFSALVETTYGRLLIAKVVLFALMLVGAAFSRAWVRAHVGVPAVVATAGPALAVAGAPGAAVAGAPGDGSPADGTRKDGDPREGDPRDGDPKDGDPKDGDATGGAAGPGPGSEAGLRSLRRSVGAEALIAAGVLAVTAGLVNAVPGETALGSGEPFAVEIHGNDVLVEASVDPAEQGPVTVEITTLGHDGSPLDPEEVSASLRLPAQDLGPIDVALEEDSPGVFTSQGAELPFPGEWELMVVVRTSDIDQDRLSTPFTVR